MLLLQSVSFTVLRYFTDIFHLKFVKSSILNLNLQYSCIMSDVTDHYNNSNKKKQNKKNKNNNNNNNNNNNALF